MKHILFLLFSCIAFNAQAQQPDSTIYVLDTVTYKKVQGAYHYFRFDKRVRPAKLYLAMDDVYYSKKMRNTYRTNTAINSLIIVSAASLMGYQFYNMWNDLEVNKDNFYVAAGIVGLGIPLNVFFNDVYFTLVRKNNRNIQNDFRKTF